MFCSSCGKKVPANSVFCPSCGAKVENGKEPKEEVQVPPVPPMPPQAFQYQPMPGYYMPYKKPGNGLSIAGITTEYTVRGRYGRIYYRDDLVAFAIGLTLFQTILALIGLPLSISGMNKCKSGKNVAGVILNTITLVISVILFICVMCINS